MKIMSVRHTGCALLVAGMLFGLSACDDNGNPLNTSAALEPGSEAAKQIAAEQRDAVLAETTSIERLAKQANEPVTAEQRAAADKLTRRHRARMAARDAGDYSFQPPPASPVNRPGQLLNLPAVTSPRFSVTDRVWPDTAGELSLAMWS